MEDTFPPAPFTGFPPAAFTFFSGLAEHQNKIWFAEHKAVYQEAVQEPLASLVVAVADRLEGTGLALRGDPKRAMFRINRDVRFSADKSPYKTHASAALTRNGNKMAPGVLYIHVAPKGCFAGCGFYHPEPAVLARMRAGLADDPASWAKIVVGLAKQDLSLSTEDALVRPPKGFESAPPAIADALRLKSWIVHRNLPHALVGTSKMADAVAKLATQAAPLLRFGWSAIA